MKNQPQEQLQEIEADLGPEELLKQVRAELARLRDHEAVLIKAIDVKIAEEEARRPKPSFIEEYRRVTDKAFAEKLQKAEDGEDPRSYLDQCYANRGRAL